MSKSKQTGKTAAENASATLRDRSTGNNSKSGAGSALSQRHAPTKETSSTVAHRASEVLRDDRTAAKSKSASGSALSQKPRGAR